MDVVNNNAAADQAAAVDAAAQDIAAATAASAGKVAPGGGAAAAAATAAALEEGEMARRRSNYHYWHGNVAENRARGDVAPMPVHTVLASEVVTLNPVNYRPISRYSWCNNEKTVDVYVDWPNLDPEAVSVTFLENTLTADIREGETVVHRLSVRLSKRVFPDECKFKCKPSQLAIKLKKHPDEVEVWFDLQATPSIGV